MESILQAFHIDWKLLIAQVINFALVVGVLGFGVFKPLMKKMTERSQMINDGIDNATQAKQSLLAAEKEYQAIVATAKNEALGVIKNAQEQASRIEREAVEAAQEKVKDVIARGKIQLAEMKLQTLADARESLADLVVAATEKVIKVKLSDKVDEKLIKDSLTSLEK